MSDDTAPPSKYSAMKYSLLQTPSPKLDLEYVRRLRALYKGGKALLANKEVMDVVFPKHEHEGAKSYEERKKRAYYENVFAQCVNKIVAGLGQDPIRLDPQPDENGNIPTDAELDGYWKQLQKDATPPNDDGEAKTFDQILRQVACEGFVTGRGWILCDLPAPTGEDTSLADQEKSDALKAYPVPYRADQVTDWYEVGGMLKWVRSYSCTVPADDPTQPRMWTRHEWKIWDKDGATPYVVEINRDGKDRAGVVVNAEYSVQPGTMVPHSFKRVPWVCFDTCGEDEPQMHVGDLIESQVRNLFNQSCGAAYIRLRHMYQQLYEFLGPEINGIGEGIGEAQSDPARARGRRRGPDIIQERGSEDSAMFVSPNMDGAEIDAKAIEAAREAIKNVTGQLALSQDNTGATIGRSGLSKQQDKIEEEVVLGAAGKKLLGFGRQVIKILAIGRGDIEPDDDDDSSNSVPYAAGYTSFDISNIENTISRAVELEGISLPSATFQIEHKTRIMVDELEETGGCDQNMRQAIRDDLEQVITQDQFTGALALVAAKAIANAADPEADPEAAAAQAVVAGPDAAKPGASPAKATDPSKPAAGDTKKPPGKVPPKPPAKAAKPPPPKGKK